METEPVLRCPACGSTGRELYRDLEDHHFGTPGRWRLQRCDGCRSLWLDPRPATDQLHLAYVEYYTHGELEDPPGGSTAKRLLAFLPSHRDDRPGRTAHLDGTPGRALDLGCGDGRTAVALQDAGWSVVAIDQDPASIEAARAAGVVDARVGTLDELTDEAPFDAVVLSHVIEHLVDPVEVLRAVRDRIRPGGRLVVLTPNAESASHERFGPAWRGLEVPRHLQVLSASGLREVLEHAGLTVGSLRSSSRGANGVARASRTDAGGDGLVRRLGAYAEGEWWQARVEVRRRSEPFAGEELVAFATA